MDETVNVAQVMRSHGVSRRTVYNWVNHGKVKAIKTPGGSLRIYTESLWRPARPDSAYTSYPHAPTA